jgi:tetratricopeptide (TPR) repeat protein
VFAPQVLLLWTAVSLLQEAPAVVAGGNRTEEIARAEALHEQGLRAFESGDLESGRAAIAESLKIHEKWREHESCIVNLRGLAFGHEGLGERQLALQFYERALDRSRRTGNKRLEASTLRDIGVLYYNIDDNARAIGYMERSLALQRTIDKPATLAATLFSLGEIRRYLGQLALARKDFDEALRLARESKNTSAEADALSSLGMLDVKAGDLPGGRKRLDEALSIRLASKDIRGEASVRARMGLYLEAAGDREAAMDSLRAAVGRFVEVKYRGGEAFARQSLAMLLRKSGRAKEAADEMLLALEAAESLRRKLADRDLRATYIGYVQGRYEFLIDALLEVDGGNPRRAFEMSERARAREIVEALADAGVRGAAGPGVSLDVIQQELLDSETTLLEYALGEPASHLFVVSKFGIVHRKLPGRGVLEAAARKAYEAYRQPGGAWPAPDGEKLRQLLLGGDEGFVGKRLLVVADGALQYLPFAHIMPRDMPIVIAPSSSALMALRKAAAGRPAGRAGVELAVFADPLAPHLARLPFSRQEAAAIMQVAGSYSRSSARKPGEDPASCRAQRV